MHPQLLYIACNLYNTDPEALKSLSGGHSNAVYQFSLGDKSAILRIGVEDCLPEQTLGMLEWVRFLSLEGAPVTAPRLSIHGRLMERIEFEGKYYTLTAFEKADGILAENIPPSAWTEALFHSIGKAVGKFHRITKVYQPAHPSLKRPYWFDSYEIQEATEMLASSSDPAREQLITLVAELRNLPMSLIDFGLIHDDIHFANFLILPDGEIRIIDFDDCVYGWFAMDVAMALFDVLVLYHASSEGDQQRFAYRFMSNYLSGYRQENDLSVFWLSQIPKFLKLKELCIYATLIDHPEIAMPESWVGRFMRSRAKRIANNLPYIDIDFAIL